MTLTAIAVRNLMRRKGKAAFVLAGLLIGVSTVVAIVNFVASMARDINHKLEKYGANILIVPRSESLALSYGGISLGGVAFDMKEMEAADLSHIRGIKNAANVAAVGPMVLGVVRVMKQSILMAGVDFSSQKILKPWWRVDGSIPGENAVLMGSEAGRILGLEPGDTVALGPYRLGVAGVLAPTGSQDDHLLFSTLPTAQRILDKPGRITLAEVAALCTACPIEEMVKQISEALPGAKVMAIQQVVRSRMETLNQFRRFSYAVSAVILLIGSLVVMVTLMGSVRERTEEIGVFRAVGFRKSHIMRIVYLEAVMLSGLAGVLGFLVGLGVSHAAANLIATKGHIAFHFNGDLAGAAVAMAVLLGLLASTYPALLASRMDPTDALRAI
jgi:putative ABC transport system permease protein